MAHWWGEGAPQVFSSQIFQQFLVCPWVKKIYMIHTTINVNMTQIWLDLMCLFWTRRIFSNSFCYHISLPSIILIKVFILLVQSKSSWQMTTQLYLWSCVVSLMKISWYELINMLHSSAISWTIRWSECTNLWNVSIVRWHWRLSWS